MQVLDRKASDALPAEVIKVIAQSLSFMLHSPDCEIGERLFANSKAYVAFLAKRALRREDQDYY